MVSGEARAAFDTQFDHEHVEVFDDPTTGLRGAIAIHSRTLGPAMGGVRLNAYPGIGEAVGDALRLAAAMTLKSAAAGLDLGGGKTALLDDGAWSDPDLRAARMSALGARIERLGGAYVAAEDVGTTPADMESIGHATRWVAGRPTGSGGRGDPSASTARTVFAAIAAAAEVRFGAVGLDGLRVGVVGAGHVGSRLAAMLAAAGAAVTVADLVPARAEQVAATVGAAVAAPAALQAAALDVLAPCALGGTIASEGVGSLRTAIVAGAANNQLADPDAAIALHRAGILFVPDFVANCGGIIDVGAEVLGFGDEGVEERVMAAGRRTGDLLRRAAAEGRVPWELALELARERIADASAGLGQTELELAR